MQRPLFITLEGGEGAGKTSHIEALRADFESAGRTVLVVREPGGTAIGEAIRTILLSPEHGAMVPRAELLLYEAARAQLVDEVIKPALADGAVVLCDRFFDSTSAYQGAGRGLESAFIDKLNLFATADLVPDATIVLDLPVDVGLTRARTTGAPDRLEAASHGFHEQVRTAFCALAEAHPARVRMVDATQPLDVTYVAVRTALEEVLGEVF
ncbi:MAG: dTMP kinase [Coriobacteriia bacterium]|nr:dTMP kinase [Coriobacteriia bacterium]